MAWVLMAAALVPQLGCTDDADDELAAIDEDGEAAPGGRIENLLPASCDEGDWNKLFAYIKAQAKSPDIFTTQQISYATQLAALTTRADHRRVRDRREVLRAPRAARERPLLGPGAPG